MTSLNASARDTHEPGASHNLTRGTLAAAALAACLAEAALAIPALLNGLFQQDIGTTSSSQLTWITDGFLVPVSLFELTFGVLGDLFGRKRLLIGGALLLGRRRGRRLPVAHPGSAIRYPGRVLMLWTGQISPASGRRALFPTSLAMVAPATHTAQAAGARRSRSGSPASPSAGLVGPVLGGVAAEAHYGSDVNAGWRWAFLVVLVLAVASAGLSSSPRTPRPRKGARSTGPARSRSPSPFSPCCSRSFRGPPAAGAAARSIGCFIAAAVFPCAFVVAELRSPAPLLQLAFFRHRSFAAARSSP